MNILTTNKNMKGLIMKIMVIFMVLVFAAMTIAAEEHSIYINADGNVGIGTTEPGALLEVHNSSWGLSVRIDGNGLLFNRNANSYIVQQNTSGRLRIGVGDISYEHDGITILNGGNVGIGILYPTHLLHVNGVARSTQSTWATSSDMRLKDVKGEFKYGLNEILKINTFRFNYKRDNPLNLPSDKEYYGISAQDIEKIFPEAVTIEKDGYRTVSNDPIIWAMLNAIKELKAEIETLKSSVK